MAVAPTGWTGLAVLATMHRKESVMAPVLEHGLGMTVALVPGLDTDRFGTFSREVARTGSQLDAARAKIAAAFQLVPDARFGVASEGSFGPHPSFPWVVLGRELVLLIDRHSGLELTGHDLSLDTCAGQQVVDSTAAARAFADRIGFPGQGVIVTACPQGEPSPTLGVCKDIADHHDLERAVGDMLTRYGAAHVEADLRAHRNPVRMHAIGRATADLVRRCRSLCPACGHPGFDVTDHEAGLPCGVCRRPTRLPTREILSCLSCEYRESRPVGAAGLADPKDCDYCNP